MERKQGKTIRSGAREIIAHVIDACDQEAENNSLLISLKQRTQRAVLYTGVSESTVKKIRQEHRSRPALDASLVTSWKKRPRLSFNETIDDLDFQVIRRTIEDFYINLKQVPTCGKLIPALRAKIDFPYGRRTLQRLLHSRGFV